MGVEFSFPIKEVAVIAATDYHGCFGLLGVHSYRHLTLSCPLFLGLRYPRGLSCSTGQWEFLYSGTYSSQRQWTRITPSESISCVHGPSL